MGSFPPEPLSSRDGGPEHWGWGMDWGPNKESTLETVELEMSFFPAPAGDAPGDTSAAVAPASAHTLVAPRCQRKLQE